jgi:hypothetical protein
MATTKNGKIKKLLAKCLTKTATKEAHKPRAEREHKEMLTVKDEKGESKKVESIFVLVDKSHGRNDRRSREIERLKAALKGGGKKERMAGFAHKKDRALAKKAEKANSKMNKGKKKKLEE